MIVAAHQPHFLPWLGYLNKALSADVFIWLDTVQYRKNYFQNRTRIMSPDGREQWLTLPVHAGSTSSIDTVTIAEPRWRERVAKSVHQWYGKAPHYGSVWPALEDALRAPTEHLAEIDYSLFTATLKLFRGPVPRVVRASELGAAPVDPTDRLVTLCQRVGGDRYIGGRSGPSYMRLEAFERARIDIVWQKFDVERTAYERRDGHRVAGLSVLDALCHVGPTETERLARGAWSVPSAGPA